MEQALSSMMLIATNPYQHMTVKELLIQEIEDIADPLLIEVLDYLRYLKFKQEEDTDDLREARAVLKEARTEGTISWEEVKAQAGL